MEYKCCIMNDKSEKPWPFNTHKERTEADTAAFMNRTTESDTKII